MSTALTPATVVYGHDSHRIVIRQTSAGVPVDHGTYGGTWKAQARPRLGSDVEVDLDVTIESGDLVLTLSAADVETVTDSRRTWVFDVRNVPPSGPPFTFYRGELTGPQGVTE